MLITDCTSELVGPFKSSLSWKLQILQTSFLHPARIF
ncbi:hypothetical protein LEMLEM_LOCUS4925 [Lemmus lemmus]